jgi:hypothetical protein
VLGILEFGLVAQWLGAGGGPSVSLDPMLGWAWYTICYSEGDDVESDSCAWARAWCLGQVVGLMFRGDLEEGESLYSAPVGHVQGHSLVKGVGLFQEVGLV